MFSSRIAILFSERLSKCRRDKDEEIEAFFMREGFARDVSGYISMPGVSMSRVKQAAKVIDGNRIVNAQAPRAATVSTELNGK